jgi:hypothetical protein
MASAILNSIRFACTSLAGVNKAGTLKKDADGYYEVVVGALNFFNTAGELYVYEQAKHLFTSSSQLMRRVGRGALRGEYGHPKMVPGMSQDQFANRIMSIYEENVCCHFREVTLDFDRIKDANGKPVIAIIAWVKPSGPNAKALQDSLDNPSENVCFSIRAFTDDYRDRGIKKRVLKTIVTWDYVNEPGISVAEKFKSPSLESLFDQSFSRGNLERACDKSQMVGLATESALLTADELFRSMGWASTPSMVALQKTPSYMSW